MFRGHQGVLKNTIESSIQFDYRPDKGCSMDTSLTNIEKAEKELYRKNKYSILDSYNHTWKWWLENFNES